MFRSPSLTIQPTQDNTLCSLPTGLINTCCRDSTYGYFSWDYSSGDILILAGVVCVRVCVFESVFHQRHEGPSTWSPLAHFWCDVRVCGRMQVQTNLGLSKTNNVKCSFSPVNMVHVMRVNFIKINEISWFQPWDLHLTQKVQWPEVGPCSALWEVIYLLT